MNRTAFFFSVGLLACACLDLSAAEGDLETRHYAFLPSPPEKPNVRTCLLIGCSDGVLPFLVLGQPTQGDVVLKRPERQDVYAIALESQESAHLLRIGEVSGSLSVRFDRWNGVGNPTGTVQLGKELQQARRSWTLTIDKFGELTFVGKGASLMPDPLLSRYALPVRQKRKNMNDRDDYVFDCPLEGTLSVNGRDLFAFSAVCRLRSYKTEQKAPGRMWPRLDLACAVHCPGKAFGLGDRPLELRFFLTGKGHVREGGSLLDDQLPQAVDTDVKELFDELDL